MRTPCPARIAYPAASGSGFPARGANRCGFCGRERNGGGQFGRRNLPQIDAIALADMRREILARKAKASYSANVGRPSKSKAKLPTISKVSTRAELAAEAGVGERTFDAGNRSRLPARSAEPRSPRPGQARSVRREPRSRSRWHRRREARPSPNFRPGSVAPCDYKPPDSAPGWKAGNHAPASAPWPLAAGRSPLAAGASGKARPCDDTPTGNRLPLARW
jgi:hypothetical protein